MRTAVDALVTGFVKSPLLAERSFAPLRQLRREGHIRDIHYVTWDSAEIDPLVEPVSAMEDVRVTRIPQPEAKGNANQRGVVYQVKNLEAALKLVRGSDVFVLKSRPDVVVRADFLRDKILDFDSQHAIEGRRPFPGIVAPPPAFEHKVWIPWADANQPFFCEDAMFLATARDARKFVTALTPDDLEILADSKCGPYAHIVRYAKIFTGRFPLFANYLRNYRYFVNDMDYRLKLLPFLLGNGFFWHLLIAHAWILHSHFHVDAGDQGDIQFYPNNVNQNADWSNPDGLKLANPYDVITRWRDGTRPELATHCLRRAYGRLVDDAWQTGLFTGSPPDFPRASLAGLLGNAVQSADGRLSGLEREFYLGLERQYAEHWSAREAAA